MMLSSFISSMLLWRSRSLILSSSVRIQMVPLHAQLLRVYCSHRLFCPVESFTHRLDDGLKLFHFLLHPLVYLLEQYYSVLTCYPVAPLGTGLLLIHLALFSGMFLWSFFSCLYFWFIRGQLANHRRGTNHGSATIQLRQLDCI